MRTPLALLATLALTAAFANAACGGDDDDAGSNDLPTDKDASAVVATAKKAASAISVGGTKGGSARVTVDGKSTDLTVEECNLAGPGGTVAVVASGKDTSLTVGGLPSGATIAFMRDNTQWLAAATKLDISGKKLNFSGDAFKLPDTKATKLELAIECK